MPKELKSERHSVLVIAHVLKLVVILNPQRRLNPSVLLNR